MQTHVHEASVAFTYAWWLTGDETAAEAAVLAAARTLPPLGAGQDAPEDRLPALLGAVRRAAAPQRTMCRASELALLHDSQALSLEVAAELVAIPQPDVTTELAHGRLEALLETITEPFVHPERLGGLAVGNPPDIAHSRTCSGCEAVLALLRQGRQELGALPPVPTPPSILVALAGMDPAAAAAAATGPVRVSRRTKAGASVPPSGTGGPNGEPVPEASDGPGLESVDAPGSGPEAEPHPRDASPPAPAGTQAESHDAAVGSAPPDGTVGSAPPDGAVTEGAVTAGVGLDAGARRQAHVDALVVDTEPPATSNRRGALVGVTAVVVGLLILLLTALTGGPGSGGPAESPPLAGAQATQPDPPAPTPQPGNGATAPAPTSTPAPEPGVTPDPDPDAVTEPPTTAPPEETATAPPETAAFAVVDAGVLPAGATAAQGTGATIAPGESLRISVRYTGAADGVVLAAVTDIPDGLAPRVDVTLASAGSTHLFLWVAPPEGWPPGTWQVQLLADGELAGVIDVTVA